MFKIETELSKQEVVDLLTTALEGGSNYWYDNIRFYREDGSETTYKGGDVLWMLINGTATAKFCDIEDWETEWELTAEMIHKNMQSFAKVRDGDHLRDVLKEDWDAITADVFFQCVTFGEVVYG